MRFCVHTKTYVSCSSGRDGCHPPSIFKRQLCLRHRRRRNGKSCYNETRYMRLLVAFVVLVVAFVVVVVAFVVVVVAFVVVVVIGGYVCCSGGYVCCSGGCVCCSSGGFFCWIIVQV